MKKKIMIGTGVLTILAALFFTACHHRSPEARIGWIKDEITDRLALDAAQQERLNEITTGLLERKKLMHRDREALRGTVMAELKKEHIDRSVVEGLVSRKRVQMDELVDYLIDNTIAFHEMLTPQQREKLVAELDKLHARAEKYGHDRW